MEILTIYFQPYILISPFRDAFVDIVEFYKTNEWLHITLERDIRQGIGNRSLFMSLTERQEAHIESRPASTSLMSPTAFSIHTTDGFVRLSHC